MAQTYYAQQSLYPQLPSPGYGGQPPYGAQSYPYQHQRHPTPPSNGYGYVQSQYYPPPAQSPGPSNYYPPTSPPGQNTYLPNIQPWPNSLSSSGSGPPRYQTPAHQYQQYQQAHGPPPPYNVSSPGHNQSTLPSPMPDLSKLNLNDGKIAKNWSSCDGCSANPIQGMRWRCLSCSDYDLCGDCKDANVHSQHRLEYIPPFSEQHLDACCDGCSGANGDRLLVGPRYKCQVHEDEDWCQRCVDSRKACGGPYTIIRQSAIAMQLERDNCLPMPQEWIPQLRPVLATYNGASGGVCAYPPGLSVPLWMSTPTSQYWYNKAKRLRRSNRVDAVYKATGEFKQGSMGRDSKYTWSFGEYHRGAEVRPLFTYLRRLDPKTHCVISSTFTSTAKHATSTTPILRRSSTHDALTFHDPSDSSILYTWRSNRPLSTLGNERFDFQRVALFRSRGGKEALVADFTWWDGHATSPEDCLSIRDAEVSHALILAAMFLYWESARDVVIDEWKRDPEGVRAAERQAYMTGMGAERYITEVPGSNTSAGNGKKKGGRVDKDMVKGGLKVVGAGLKLGQAIMQGGDSSSGGDFGSFDAGGACGGDGGGCSGGDSGGGGGGGGC